MDLQERLIDFHNTYKYTRGANKGAIDMAYDLLKEANPKASPGAKNCSGCVGSVFAQLVALGKKELLLKEAKEKEEARLLLEIEIEEARILLEVENKAKEDVVVEPVIIKKKAGRPKKIKK